MKIRLITALFALFSMQGLIAQSNDCLTATPITLTNGSACLNGTTVNATSSNTLYSTCNVTGLNEVWYTYTASGANNDFQITSLGLTNAQIVIYTVSCGLGGTLELCDNVTGTTTLNTSWGFTPGTQVWIGVMSNVGIEGNFELCVDSYAPDPSGGNTCAGAIPICDIGVNYTINMNSLSSSGTTPSCFLGTGNQDVWIQFEVTQAGTIEWSATPSANDVELDWALFDISGGCPTNQGGWNAAEIACNYNYAQGIGAGVGMNDAISCVACPTSAVAGACEEFCTEAFLPTGTYVLVIDQYEGSPATLDFIFENGTTALISPVANFTVSPALVCGPNMTVNITDNSIGGSPDWTFGNGDTYSGSNPPAEFYDIPGTYAITATIPGACPSTNTEFVQLLAPLAGTVSGVDETCLGSCNGSASISTISGGDGVYTYTWFDVGMNPIGQSGISASGLCAGDYIVQVANAACGTTLDIPVTIATSGTNDDPTFSMTPTCDGGNASISGTLGGTFSFNSPPGDAAVIDPSTGLITNGTSGATYDVLYTTNGPCSASSNQNVTVLTLDDASFSMTPSCDGGVAVITGTTGGTFSFNTAPGDAAVIDPSTGLITNGTSGNTYDILYTTSGVCPSSSIEQVTASNADDPSFSMTATCDGGTASISGTAGGTFTFAIVPTDGAVIDPVTGTVSGGSSGAVYDIQYTTAGACSESSTEQVTVLLEDDPSFTLSPTCDGGTATVSGLAGGTFVFNVAPSDAAVIDGLTGTVSGGTSSATYEVLYTTNGICPATLVQQVTALSQDDATFSMTPTCDGGFATISGTTGGTFTFTTSPSDGATIDSGTGSVSGGTPGTSYDVTYSTTGTCPSSSNIQFTAFSLPPAPAAGIDSVYCSSDIYANMSVIGTGGTYTWYDASSNVLGTGTSFQPLDILGVTDYFVTETVNGCEGPSSIVTITIQGCSITIPTAITPNGDMDNDTWEIIDLDIVYPDNTVRVFNRWGSLIFEHVSNNGENLYNDNKWNGTYDGDTLPVGSYYYVIDLNDKDGNVATGSVSIILD